MAHLSQTPPNMSSIGEVCDRLGKTFLMSLLGNHRATGALRMNSSSVKGGLSFVPARGECNIADDTQGGLARGGLNIV